MKRQLIYHTHVETNKTQHIEVNLKTESLETTCRLERVSRDGLTLSCDTSTLHLLMPNNASVAPRDPTLLNANFSVEKNINANCRIVFTRRLSKNKFILELKFVDISDKNMSCLDEFIEKSLSNKVKERHYKQDITHAKSVADSTEHKQDFSVNKAA